MFNFHTALSGGSKSKRDEKEKQSGGVGVSLKEARAHFEAYYDKKKPGYSAMSKKRDAEVKKSGKWLLIPNTPESQLYLKEHGVKYYDMLGVDAFDEDTFTMKDRDGNMQTYRTKPGAETKSKVKYSEYFKKEYDKRWPNPKVNIVNFRWIKEYKKRINAIKDELSNVDDKIERGKLEDKLKELESKMEKLQAKAEVLSQKQKESQKAEDGNEDEEEDGNEDDGKEDDGEEEKDDEKDEKVMNTNDLYRGKDDSDMDESDMDESDEGEEFQMEPDENENIIYSDEDQ